MTLHPPDNAIVLSELYAELRLAARRLLFREARDISLRPTELVNEAAMRVLAINRMHFNDRQHLFATCARVLRQTLIDEIRKRNALKRQIPNITWTFDDSSRSAGVEALHAALEQLEAISPELAELVDMRYFVGLSIEEIADATGQSESTIKRRWRTARAWLLDAMESDGTTRSS